MEISFKIIVLLFLLVAAAVITLSLISMLSGQSQNMLSKLICFWC